MHAQATTVKREAGELGLEGVRQAPQLVNYQASCARGGMRGLQVYSGGFMSASGDVSTCRILAVGVSLTGGKVRVFAGVCVCVCVCVCVTVCVTVCVRKRLQCTTCNGSPATGQ